MLITDLFSKDACPVCGQTPCNCTHLHESLADEFLKMAHDLGYKNARIAGTPEQERERSQQILAQRAREREEASRQAALNDARILDDLKDQYKKMNDRYEALGGSNWQYADREQNLTDREREARSMEPALGDLRGRIARAEAAIAKEGVTEGNETMPFGRVTNTTPNYSQAWKVTDEGEEFLRKAYQRLKRAYEEEGQVGMINIGPALSELQQQKFGPAYVQQSGPYQMMTTDISRLIEKIEPWQKQYNQQHIATDFDPEDFSNWNKQQKMSENTSRKVDAKGRTQSEWMQAVKQKFPDAKIVQAKMIDGPAHALLSDGRKIVWNPVQGVTEVGQNFRRGNDRRAALNAMSPEELKAHEEKRAEQQRKRDEARLERERQRNAAKKGVAEGAGNIGNAIKSLYQKIYNAGDDEIEYFYNDSPIFAQYWDEYEGDLDSIIAEVDPSELAVIKSELESYVDDANLAESKSKEKEADYGPDYQDMVARVKKLAGLGPLKTVYDPQKRVYKNVPTAVQPKK